MDQRSESRSLGDLFGDLSRSLGTLIHQEMELARTEVRGQVAKVSRDAVLIGTGGLLLYAGLLALLAAAVLGLVEMGVTPWLAALVVAILVVLVGAVMVAAGREGLRQTDLMPRKTIQSVKDDADWAKERLP
jgi:uncharacterized protein YacL